MGQPHAGQTEAGPPPGRRRLLQQVWTWLQLAGGALLLYPLVRFLGFHAPRKPRLVKVHRKIPVGGFAVEHDFILFVGKKGPWAVSRRCTHLGCRLNYREGEQLLLCPCHQSRFTIQGKVINGPARKSLPTFPVQPLSGPEGPGFQVSL